MRKYRPAQYWVDFIAVAVATTAFFAVVLPHTHRIPPIDDDAFQALTLDQLPPDLIDGGPHRPPPFRPF
jgi:hypothetical protein